MKPITIKNQPIELVPSETFTVTLSWPTNLSYAELRYLDGVLTRAKKCDCPSRVLLESGCQCGGV